MAFLRSKLRKTTVFGAGVRRFLAQGYDCFWRRGTTLVQKPRGFPAPPQTPPVASLGHENTKNLVTIQQMFMKYYEIQ